MAAERYREQVRLIRRSIEARKQAARKAEDQELLGKLDRFSRAFESTVSRSGPLDRYT